MRSHWIDRFGLTSNTLCYIQPPLPILLFRRSIPHHRASHVCPLTPSCISRMSAVTVEIDLTIFDAAYNVLVRLWKLVAHCMNVRVVVSALSMNMSSTISSIHRNCMNVCVVIVALSMNISSTILSIHCKAVSPALPPTFLSLLLPSLLLLSLPPSFSSSLPLSFCTLSTSSPIQLLPATRP